MKPSAPARTSWGAIDFRGSAYSVMMTCVARPVGRGNILQRVLPALALAQIDRGKIFGDAPRAVLGHRPLPARACTCSIVVLLA